VALRGIGRHCADCCVEFVTDLGDASKYLKQRVKRFYKINLSADSHLY
jgi:hypothetical protein